MCPHTILRPHHKSSESGKLQVGGWRHAWPLCGLGGLVLLDRPFLSDRLFRILCWRFLGFLPYFLYFLPCFLGHLGHHALYLLLG